MRMSCVAPLVCLALAACGGDSGGGTTPGEASESGNAIPHAAPSEDHTGIYQLDRDQFRAMALDAIKRDAGIDEVPPEQAAMIDGMIAQATVDITLRDDGSWTATGAMGGSSLDESGTYTVVGESITFFTTKKDGKDFKDQKTGHITGGVITVRPDEEMPGALRLVRR